MRFLTNKQAIMMATVVAMMAVSIGADALAGGGSNPHHELQVYSLKTYGNQYDYCISQSNMWKPDLSDVLYTKDPYRYFWDEMYTNCSTSVCAYSEADTSRRQNSAVTVNNMVGNWRKADMVFFHGHNAMIAPQWSNDPFLWWKPQYIGDIVVGWCEEEDEWLGWGTSSDPYYYHHGTIDDASLSNAGAVFYAYNGLTSVLPGFDFIDGTTWNYENTKNGSASSWDVPLSGGELEWIIANGCQAVTTAKAQNGTWTSSDPIVSCPLGVNAWSKSWGKLHMVLGHYYRSYLDKLPDLGGVIAGDFASYLKGGDVIKDAYFDSHTSNSAYYPALYQPSAISRESKSCCTWFGGLYLCQAGGCSDGYMKSETWKWAPQDDITSNYWYATSWRVAE